MSLSSIEFACGEGRYKVKLASLTDVCRGVGEDAFALQLGHRPRPIVLPLALDLATCSTPLTCTKNLQILGVVIDCFNDDRISVTEQDVERPWPGCSSRPGRFDDQEHPEA